MFIIIYQLLLFGIKPIRKRILHWLDEASEATDFKPYIINSELYLGVTCVAPFIWLLVMNILLNFISNDTVKNIIAWDTYIGHINGVVHFGIFVISLFHIDIMSPFRCDDDTSEM